MILGGALITQYKTKEEAEPARFKNFQNRFHRKLTGSVEYRGVVPEEDDSVSLYGERSQTIFMMRDPALREPLSTVERSTPAACGLYAETEAASRRVQTSGMQQRLGRRISRSTEKKTVAQKTPRRILSPQGYKNLSPPTPLLRFKTLAGFFYNLV